MAARRASRSRRPQVPDLPGELQALDGSGPPGDTWDGLRMDATAEVPERIADLAVTECVLDGVDLTSRRLTGFHARDTVFEHCELSGAILDGATLTRVRFVGCRMNGVMLGAARLADVSFEECRAPMANFRSAELLRVLATNCTLTGAEFQGTVFAETYLYDCALEESDFVEARVRGLDLHGSSLSGVRGVLSLRGARVDTDQLIDLGVAALAEVGIRTGDRLLDG